MNSAYPQPIPFDTIRSLREELQLPIKGLSQRTKILLLSATLVAFFVVGLVHSSVKSVALLIGVLAFHEFGHFLAMRLLGYKNINAFFIPFLGAAVTGTPSKPSATKAGLVYLAGPLPGLLLGTALVVAFKGRPSGNAVLLAKFLLVVNIFNLVPVSPLDGGRLTEVLLFSKARRLEMVFRAISAAALILLGLARHLNSIVIVGYLLILAIKTDWNLSETSNRIADYLRSRPDCSAGHDFAALSDESLAALSEIVSKLRRVRKLKTRQIANTLRTVSKRLDARAVPPPKAWQTLVLFTLYAGGIALGIIGLRPFYHPHRHRYSYEVTQPQGFNWVDPSELKLGPQSR